jgi:hypothetical protein
MLIQLARAAPDARVRLAHAGIEIGVHRNRILVHRPPLASYAIPWRGEASIALPHGTLDFLPTRGTGIVQSAIEKTAFDPARRGGERTVSYAAGVARAGGAARPPPHWQRAVPPSLRDVARSWGSASTSPSNPRPTPPATR